jgi:putative DNA primase/helicase
MTPILVEGALGYARRGWPVVPLHGVAGSGACSCGGDCSKPGKRPYLRDWRRRATTDVKTVRRHWSEWPLANVGVLTGRRSGVVVLDVDPAKGGAGTLARLEAAHGALPRTPEVATGGGGRHLWFRCPPGGLRGRAGALGAGLDLLADGQQVVAPPSLHASGGRYRWLIGPEDVPLAGLPPWVLAAREQVRSAEREAGPGDHPRGARGGPARPIPEGLRNTTLTQLAGRLVRVGVSPAGVAAALRAENESRCRPPLAPGEVESLARSAARWSAAPDRVVNPLAFANDPALTSRARRALLVLALTSRADGTCRASYRTVSTWAGIPKNGVGQVMEELERNGRVLILSRSRYGTTYRLVDQDSDRRRSGGPNPNPLVSTVPPRGTRSGGRAR